jgi:hypothetical protein
MKRCVKENKRFEDSKVFKCFQHGTHQELCKPIWNQRKKSKRNRGKRKRKKVEEIHVED